MGAWTRYPEVGNVALNPGNIVADQFHGAVVVATAKHAAAPAKSSEVLYEAQETAKEFESTATCLRNSPENFEVQSDSEILRYYRDLRFLVVEIKKTIAEKQRRESALIQGGITLP